MTLSGHPGLLAASEVSGPLAAGVRVISRDPGAGMPIGTAGHALVDPAATPYRRSVDLGLAPLDVVCDHHGGDEYHCAECCPGCCEMHAPEIGGLIVAFFGLSQREASCGAIREVGRGRLDLDLGHGLTRDFLVRWLASGMSCRRCRGSGVVASVEGEALDCSFCDGDGLLRPRWDRHWARDKPRVLAECVRRVSCGEPPLDGVLGPWHRLGGDGLWERPPVAGYNARALVRDRLEAPALPGQGDGWIVWGISNPTRRDEVGAAGRAAADACARAGGLWLQTEPGESS